MASVLFVDDDVLTLGKLRTLIDWEAHGYRIAGQSMDGESALAQIHALRPDLVILDINMPRKSGIAVAEAVQRMDAPPYILVLSNHDTFAYVRQVMKFGALDYLLKHELTAALLEQKLREIDALRRQSSLAHQWDVHTAALAKQQYLRALALSAPIEASYHQLMATQPEFATGRGVVALLRIERLALFTYFDGAAARRHIVDSAQNLLSSTLPPGGANVLTALEDGLFLIFFAQDSNRADAEAMRQASAWLSMLSAGLHRFLGITARHAMSGMVASVDEIPAQAAALQGILAAGLPPPAGIEPQAEQRLMDALAALDIQGARQAVSDILARQGEGVAEQLLRVSRLFADAHHIDLPESYLRPLQNQFRAPLAPNALREAINAHFHHLIARAQEDALPDCSQHVRGAIAYIHTHYAGDITLTTAADHLGISNAYLSRQFHKEVGQSFVDYVTGYRIGQAKALLRRPDMRIADVCRRCGFAGYNYFLRVFKKHTGQTVTQYAQALRAGGAAGEDV